MATEERPRRKRTPADPIEPGEPAPALEPWAEGSDAADGGSPGPPSEPPDDRPQRLAAALGLRFRNPDLLRLALTHRSVLHDWALAAPGLPTPQSNERLEFLGDALLGLIAAEYLYRRYPDLPEGPLTRRRVTLVRAERLVAWAREIDLADYLYLGAGERVTEGARDRMLAGGFEALLGAIYLDRGLPAARRFLRRFLARDVDRLVEQEEEANPKGRLQEVAQERQRAGPVYRTIAIEGPAHARVFTAEVLLQDRVLGVGTGGSKRDAEQAAARAALERLAAEGPAEGVVGTDGADGGDEGWPDSTIS